MYNQLVRLHHQKDNCLVSKIADTQKNPKKATLTHPDRIENLNFETVLSTWPFELQSKTEADNLGQTWSERWVAVTRGEKVKRLHPQLAHDSGHRDGPPVGLKGEW